MFLVENAYALLVDSLLGQNKDSLPDRGMELHVISSASKPVAGWLFRDAIQECREACAGHGYLKGKVYFFCFEIFYPHFCYYNRNCTILPGECF